MYIVNDCNYEVKEGRIIQIKLLPWVYKSVTQCDVGFLCIPRYVRSTMYNVAHNHMPRSDLVSCSFSTTNSENFHLLVPTPFLLAFSKLEITCVIPAVHVPS